LVILVSLIGCKSSEVDESKNVNQERIYQDYYAEYNADKGKFKVEVIFRFGGTNGTTLILSEPSYVNFNGTKMKGSKQLLRGQVYSQNLKSESPKDFNFEFTDLDEKTFNNSISLEPVEFVDPPSKLSQSEGGQFFWEGKPLQKDEEIWLEFKDANNVSKTIFLKTQEAKELSINPDDLTEYGIRKR
jgi:hypothetical protein